MLVIEIGGPQTSFKEAAAAAQVCMVTIAQLAEHLVVAQKAVGSSPTGHP